MKVDTLDVPDGWQARRVGDHLRLFNGYPFRPSQWAQHGLPIIRIQNLNSPTASFNYFPGELPDRFRARHGDLLFAWSGTPGTSFGAHVWGGGDAWVNQHIFRVDFLSDELDRDFLRLALNHNLDSYVSQAQGGVGLAHITKAKLNESYLLTPPLPQQQRIARLCSAVETKRRSASEHIRTCRRILTAARRATLADAFSAANASQGGASVPLKDLLREPLRNGYSARPVGHETPFRVLSLTATTSGWFDGRHFKYTDESFSDESPFWLEPGDIVVQRGNTEEYVGVAALYSGPVHTYLYPDLMIRIRPHEEINPRFIWYMLLAPQSRTYLRKHATGSAGNMPKINQGVLGRVPIPLPGDGIRRRVVELLDRYFELAAAIELRVGSAAEGVERCSRAVPAKVFRGEPIGCVTEQEGEQP